MSRPASLTRRLILTLTLGAILLWGIGALGTALILRTQLERTFDGGLREIAERLLPLAIDSLDDNDGDDDEHEISLIDPGAGEAVVFQVRHADGSVVIRSHDAPVTALPVPLAEGFDTLLPWRIYTMGDPRSGLWIHVAEAEQHRQEALWASLAALLLPLVVLVPVSIVGIFLLVRRGLAPIGQLSRQIANRDAANLQPIATEGTPAELLPMAEAVQALIGRLRTALDAERAFAANSAHELRTPIAGSLAQTQRLVAELEGQPAQARARQIENSLHRLRQLAAKLLEMSRADAGMAGAGAAIELKPALRLLVEDAARTVPPGRIVGELKGGRLVAPVDVDAFGIAVRNLIENALLHGEPTQPVRIAVPRDGMVEISNGGAIVPAERLPDLVQRFQRGNTAAPGSGLGLAIVETIMRQSGGRLELLSPAPGRTDGFCARLVLPA